MMEQKRAIAVVYVLECADGSYYTGWTHDLVRRLAAHANGRAAKYTRSRRPVRLAGWLPFCDRSAARSFEARFKRLSRKQKIDALDRRQALGVPVHKPALTMTALSAPVGDELRTLIELARTSQARLRTSRGELTFTFYPDDAPQHCAAFVKLSQSGFYDGLTFHRVEPGFVVQGGDPSGNGTGGPGYCLKAEFNERPHVRGTVAMARSSDPDSAGSQFYICLDDARFLDRQYTVFGQMTQGFDVLDALRVGDTMIAVSIDPTAEPTS